MADDLRVWDLVEGVLESERTPKEARADTPELLQAVREQAGQWLRAESAVRASAFVMDSKATCEAVRMALTRWRNEPDLTGLREPGTLNKATRG